MKAKMLIASRDGRDYYTAGDVDLPDELATRWAAIGLCTLEKPEVAQVKSKAPEAKPSTIRTGYTG